MMDEFLKNMMGKSVFTVIAWLLCFSIVVSSCGNDKNDDVDMSEQDNDEVQVINESPVDYIVIYEEMENVPPSGNLGSRVDPFPQYIQEVLHPGEKFFIGLSMNKENTENIIFDKFTYFIKNTGKEHVMPYPDDAEPFEPGGLYLINFDDPWLVQGQTGIAEIRLYYQDEIVASALIEVQENPHAGDIVVDHAGSTNGSSVRFSGTSKLPDGTVLVSTFYENDTKLLWWPEDQEIIVKDGEWRIIVSASENITQSDLELLTGPSYHFYIRHRDDPEIKSGITFDLVGPPVRE